MSHSNLVWPDGFRTVYDRAVKSYQSGPKRADTLFSAEEKTLGSRSAHFVFPRSVEFTHELAWNVLKNYLDEQGFDR